MQQARAKRLSPCNLQRSYLRVRAKLYHNPTAMGAAKATHANQCQTPVLTSAMIRPNKVSAASNMGMRQTNQKLLRFAV